MSIPNESHIQRDNRINISEVCKDIQTNFKDLDDFIAINQKLRNCAHELIIIYNQNKIDKIDRIQATIKNNLQILGKNNFQVELSNKFSLTKNLKITEDFHKLYEYIVRELNEQNIKNEFQNKNNCLKVFFKYLLQLDDLKDYLNDILKDETNVTMRKNMMESVRQRLQRNEDQNENTLFFDNLNQINNYLQNKVNVSHRNNYSKIYFTVGKIFRVLIKFNDCINLSHGFKISVSAYNELFNNISNNSRNLLLKAKNFFNMSTLNNEEKSRYKIYQKLTPFFENVLENFLKFSNYKQKGLLIFTYWIVQFSNLFKEKCHFCHKLMKYDPIEKAFFPPIYKRMEVIDAPQNESFFHDECFEWINNNHF